MKPFPCPASSSSCQLVLLFIDPLLRSSDFRPFRVADTSGLKESESVRSSQESVLKALQQYTLNHYPDVPSKFGELLLRIPELERTCQVKKKYIYNKRKCG